MLLLLLLLGQAQQDIPASNMIVLMLRLEEDKKTHRKTPLHHSMTH